MTRAYVCQLNLACASNFIFDNQSFLLTLPRTHTTQRVKLLTMADAAPAVPAFKKRGNKASAMRKRPAPPPEDKDSSSGSDTTDDETGTRIKRRKREGVTTSTTTHQNSSRDFSNRQSTAQTATPPSPQTTTPRNLPPGTPTPHSRALMALLPPIQEREKPMVLTRALPPTDLSFRRTPTRAARPSDP